MKKTEDQLQSCDGGVRVEEPEILAGMSLLFPNNFFGYTVTTLGMFIIDLDKLFHGYILNVCLFIYFCKCALDTYLFSSLVLTIPQF